MQFHIFLKRVSLSNNASRLHNLSIPAIRLIIHNNSVTSHHNNTNKSVPLIYTLPSEAWLQLKCGVLMTLFSWAYVRAVQCLLSTTRVLMRYAKVILVACISEWQSEG